MDVVHRSLDFDHFSITRDLEVSLNDLWERENYEINTAGHPQHAILLSLIGPALGAPTQRDATVAATVIQWLGTGVGRAFLASAFKSGGYKLTIEKMEESELPLPVD